MNIIPRGDRFYRNRRLKKWAISFYIGNPYIFAKPTNFYTLSFHNEKRFFNSVKSFLKWKSSILWNYKNLILIQPLYTVGRHVLGLNPIFSKTLTFDILLEFNGQRRQFSKKLLILIKFAPFCSRSKYRKFTKIVDLQIF